MKISPPNKIKIILLIIMLVTGLVYLKTASFGFVNWDDDENIRTNIRYKELSYDNIKYHFQHSRYKAIAIWSFMADAKIFGKNPGGYHIHNILLHVINILLIFILIKRITQKDTIALITAALFALHPVFVEPVAWVTGRKDLLFILFSLLSILSYLQYLKNNRKILWLLAVMVLVYLASLAKIQAITIPLLLLAVDWYYKRKISFKSLLEKIIMLSLILDKWIIFLFLSILYLLIYFYNYYKAVIRQKLSHKNIPTLFFWYLIIITFLISGLLVKFFDGENRNIFLVPIISYAVYSLGCIYALKNKRQIIMHISKASSNKKLFLFGGVFMFFLFELIIIDKIDTVFSHDFSMHLWTIMPGSENYFSLWERLILAPNALLNYLSRLFVISPQDPMIPYPDRSGAGTLPVGMITTGIIVYIVTTVIVFVLFRYLRKNRLVLLGFLWFLASMSIVLHIIPIEGRVLAADRYAYPSYIGLFMIMGVTADWLFTKISKTYVLTGVMVISIVLGIKSFIDLDTWKNSKTLWERALRVNPQNHYAMYSLSLACFAEERNPEKALKYLDQAITLKEDFQYFNNRGRIRYAVGNTDGALQDINKSIELDSNSYAAYNNRGAIKQQLMDFKSALVDYNKAIALNSRFDEAINNRRKVLHLIFLDSILNNNLSIPPEMQGDVVGFIEKASQIYINKKDFEKASFYLSKGISLFPDNVSFHEKLAVMYQLNKELGKAMEAYNRGLFYLPLDPTLLLGRGILFLELGDTIKACDDFRVSSIKGNPDAGNLCRQFCEN